MLGIKNFININLLLHLIQAIMRSLTFVFIATLSFVINIQASPLPVGDKLLGGLSDPLNKAQHAVESALISTPAGKAPLAGLRVAQDNLERGSGVHALGGNKAKLGETVGVGEPTAVSDKFASAAKTGGQTTTGTVGESVKNSDERT